MFTHFSEVRSVLSPASYLAACEVLCLVLACRAIKHGNRRKRRTQQDVDMLIRVRFVLLTLDRKGTFGAFHCFCLFVYAGSIRNMPNCTHFIFVLFSSHLIFWPLFALSLLVVTQTRVHIAGSSPPSPLRFVPCIFIVRTPQPFLPSSTAHDTLQVTSSYCWEPICIMLHRGETLDELRSAIL